MRAAPEIRAAIDEANKAVSQAEAIKRFVILHEDFTEAGGSDEMTEANPARTDGRRER